MTKIAFLGLFLMFNIVYSALSDGEKAKNYFKSTPVMPAEKVKLSLARRTTKLSCAGTPCNESGGCDDPDCFCPTIANGCIIQECFPSFCNGEGGCDDPECFCDENFVDVPVCRFIPPYVYITD